jgi:hypothetical protein
VSRQAANAKAIKTLFSLVGKMEKRLDTAEKNIIRLTHEFRNELAELEVRR